jgi:hypothetical protein
MSLRQNARKVHNIKMLNRSFENGAKSTYLGTKAINRNLIYEEIKSRLNLSMLDIIQCRTSFSSRVHSENVKSERTKIYIILPVVLYGCETRSLTLRDVYRVRLFEKRVLKRIF